MPVLIFRQGICHVKFALILILSFIQFNLNIIISSISSRARPYAFSCRVNNVKRVSKIFCVFTMLTVFCIEEGWFVKCLVFYFEKETLKSLEWGSPLNCIVVRLEGLPRWTHHHVHVNYHHTSVCLLLMNMCCGTPLRAQSPKRDIITRMGFSSPNRL